MHTRESIDYAKKAGFFDIARENANKFRKIFETNLKAKPGTQILIFADYSDNFFPYTVSLSYYIAAKRLGFFPILIFSGKGQGITEFSKTVENINKNSIAILNLANKLAKFSDIPFRRFCRINNTRFIVTTSLGMVEAKFSRTFMDALDIDYTKLRKRMLKVKRELAGTRILFIKTKAGTSIKANVFLKEPIVSDGIFDFMNIGGNLPAGEVFFAAKKGGVDGKLVIDGSARTKQETILVKKPIEIIVEKGRVVKISGDKEADTLKKALKEEYRKREVDSIFCIGEIGLGFNPKANIVGSTIIDEKAEGTAHVALGNNILFGGSISAPIHWDQVFRSPKVFADGKEVSLKLPY
jgi:leucyl aminopeptidase (aminopeptidase T)